MNKKTLVVFGILLLCFFSCQVEHTDYKRVEPVISYSAEDYEHCLDSLTKEFGSRKELPEEFELQTLLALRHYPELENTHIKFIVKRAFIPLASRPSMFSLLRKRDQRTYRVIISDRSLPQMESILLKNLPFNAQIAIIGHELAHTVEYETLNSYQLSAIGQLYIVGSFRATMEKGTDLRTIEHGLGWQLLEYAQYVRKVSGTNAKQVDFMDKYYMNPDEISAQMAEDDLYQELDR